MPAYVLPQWINDLSIEDAVKLILYNGAGSGGGGGGIDSDVNVAQVGGVAATFAQFQAYPSGTPSIFSKTAGQTETIPVGAFNIGVMFLTGTGTIGGVSWPLLTPFNIDARIASTLAVVCGSPGTALVNYLQ